MVAYGGQSMSRRLRVVLVRRPDASFAVSNPRRWGYSASPDLKLAQKEHDAFVALVRETGTEVRYLDARQPGRADAIFVHDPAIVTNQGGVLLRMGKPLRRGEEASMGTLLKRLRIPILATIRAPATAEGGDLLWVHDDVLAVGQGFRTNEEGLRQLSNALQDLGVRTVPVELPYFRGPAGCLHLMSLVSLLDDDLAVIYPRLIPVPFWKFLKKDGFEFVEVPDQEFHTMGPNVLAVAPRDCIMLEGNPVTQRRLEDAGCRVRTYRGREISLKAEGGATCLTRPILRAQ